MTKAQLKKALDSKKNNDGLYVALVWPEDKLWKSAEGQRQLQEYYTLSAKLDSGEISSKQYFTACNKVTWPNLNGVSPFDDYPNNLHLIDIQIKKGGKLSL